MALQFTRSNIAINSHSRVINTYLIGCTLTQGGGQRSYHTLHNKTSLDTARPKGTRELSQAYKGRVLRTPEFLPVVEIRSTFSLLPISRTHVLDTFISVLE